MNTNDKMYSEVDEVLSAIDEEYRSKVPKKKKDLILKHKDNSIDAKYDMSIPLNEQGISKEALSMIALIHLNYWCKNEEEKADLNKIFKENEIKNEEEKNKKYSPENIFKNQKSQIPENISGQGEHVASDNMQMIEYKENVFKKIFNFIKNLFVKKRFIDTIEDLYEPYLIQIGFLSRTSRGRISLKPAYDHFGYEFGLLIN